MKLEKTETKQQFIIKSKLLERGWTSATIYKFMSEPDQTKRNPHYKNAAPMKLYLLDRVEQIEATDQFKIEKEKSIERKQAAKKAVFTKTANTMAYVEQEVDVKVPHLSKENLISAACESYNDWHHETDGDVITKDSDLLVLHRIMVNYLRHEMTEYDYHLGEVYGKVGIGVAYLAIRKKVLDAIAKEYPWLSKECNRQK